MDFYSKQIDARFRVRVSKNDFNSKCMISYKRRKENFFKEDINNEEEVEVSVDYKDLDNLTYILEEVLKMNLVESYERYRYVFYNQDIEIDVDVYPFMIALEIENKSVNKEPNLVVMYYLERLGFSIDDTYKLSWDDKYEELCKQQNIEVYKMVTFDKKMPEFNGFIFKNK